MAASLAFIAAAPVHAADQFDLLCKGQWRFDVSAPYEPHNSHLRIDLATKRYCEEDCKVTRPIADIEPNFITFEQATDEEKALGTTFYHQVNRSTGKLTYIRSEKRPHRSWIEHDAVCEAAPFSGFPELPRKF